MNFLPFALASLRAGKNLLSLNLFFLILNCHPLLGLMHLLKAGLIHFLCIYTQLPCLWFVKRVYYNWILGLWFVVDIPTLPISGDINNCQWRFSSFGQIVLWLVVMLLFLCMPVHGVLVHLGCSLHLSCNFGGNWNTNIDSIAHALDMKFQARWSSVGLDPFALHVEVPVVLVYAVSGRGRLSYLLV
ncbi:hypothetical protein GmHk_10G027837 [Glycine max]|nr:hypothetical protein GmHk_10G027837 [Glycine max]